MSLDDRLRSGLRTLAEPEQDTERALTAFRERAYPRRARRRIFEVVGATLAVAALAVGVTAVLRITPKKSAGFVNPSRPAGMADCANDDLKITTAYDTSLTDETIVFRFTSVHKPCWVNEKIGVTFTQRNPAKSAGIQGAGILPVQGFHSAPVTMQGVVPAGRPTGNERHGLTVSWLWTNWCGDGSGPFVTFADYSAQGVKSDFTYTYNIPSVPSCTDRSKPSVLRAGASDTSIAGARSLDEPGPPFIVQPAGGLTNVTLVSTTGVYKLDDRTLLAVVAEPPCLVLDHATASETANQVAIYVYLGKQPPDTCHVDNFSSVAAVIHLSQPLGHKGVVDGKSSQPVPVASSS